MCPGWGRSLNAREAHGSRTRGYWAQTLVSLGKDSAHPRPHEGAPGAQA